MSNSIVIRIRKDVFLFFFGNLLLFLQSCSPFRTDDGPSHVSEMGGMPLDTLNLDIGESGVRMGVFRLCSVHSFKECSASSLISDAGLFLSASHNLETWNFHIKEDFDPHRIINKRHKFFAVSSIETHNNHPIEPQAFEVEVLMASKYEYYIDPDLSILRLVNNGDKERMRLNRISFPFSIAKEVPQVGERIFLAGFPLPKYNNEDINEALERYRKDYSAVYGKLPQQVNFEIPRRKLMVTSGFFSGIWDKFKIGTGVPLKEGDQGLWKESEMKHFREYTGNREEKGSYATAATDALVGFSGGPYINIRGELLGVHSSNSYRLHKVENEIFKDIPSESTTGDYFRRIVDIFNLGQFSLPRTSLEERNASLGERIAIKNQEVDSRLVEFKKYLKSLVEVLILTGKNKQVFKMNRPALFKNTIAEHNAHGVFEGRHVGATQCHTNAADP